MKSITKLKLQNFKRFQSFSVEFDSGMNVLIGDNESGKSTILLALDIVLSGSRSKIEKIGLDNLFNSATVRDFLASEKRYEDLPILFVELYLNEQDNYILNGKNNSDGVECDGLRLTCEPSIHLSREIKEILAQDEPNFPFEYYSISFTTFYGEPYTGYRKFLRHVLIDNSQISSEYALRSYINAMYHSSVSDAERYKHQNECRRYKDAYTKNVLSELNSRLDNYTFTVKTGSRANLETDLTIAEDSISIENRGKGRQCFIKTEFALKNNGKTDIDVVLIEEPENHLSHVNMKKLVRKISASQNRQIFIATHSNLISARLDLRKAILLNSNSMQPVLLKQLRKSTAKFFIKASNSNILAYVLSKKAILVEGDAEFILMEAFFHAITGMNLEMSDVHVISVGGTSFKRFLDLAVLLDIKTAVVRDNDGDYNANCVDNFSEYSTYPHIRIFSDKENARKTFEISLYQDNTAICDELFGDGRRSLSVQKFMLQNKADVAFELLDKKANDIVPPLYIREAIEWIRH